MTGKNLPILVDLHRNIYFDDASGEVSILDRRKLPETVTEHRCSDYEEVARAIEKMVTQSLGVSPAAGYGVAIAAYEARNKNKSKQKELISKSVERMKNTRPTQTSLHHLVEKMEGIAIEKIERDEDLFEAMKREAYEWTEYLMEVSRKLGDYASELIDEGDTALTHCYGGPAIYFMGDYARKDGKQIDFFCTETRPYLQGARLTSFALSQGGFDVTLITDGMAAYCIEKGMIDKFITGADRISRDGSVANKIGTYQIALAAKEHEVPFYAISYTGPDPDTRSCADVEVEERDPKDIKHVRGKRISPEEIKAFYPAFDCTPPKLVEGIVTDKGVYDPESVDNYLEK